jgi:type IV pilus assembly protein PilM
MKHRQVGVTNVGVVNSDGHAIGIDLGATAVRAAILAPGTHDGRPSVTVHGVGQIPVPEGAIVNGVVIDRPAVTAALKQLWSINKFHCHNVIVGVSSQQVVVRDLTVPNLPPDQMAKALPYQAREVVALPIDQVLLNFSPLGEPDPGAETVTGLLVAAPREPVLSAVDAVERAGLRVARVDLANFAVLRSIASSEVSVEAVVDLGAHLTSIVIHDRGVPKVVRTVPRGGNELTARLADDMNYSLQEAEAAKLHNGLTGSNREISRLLLASVRPLIAEIRSSVHYFGSVAPDAVLQRIALTGGGAGLRGLDAELANAVGVPTTVVPAMQHIRNRFNTTAEQQEVSEGWASAVSLGLAMGAAA